MNKYLLSAATIFAAMTFTACSNDTEEGNGKTGDAAKQTITVRIANGTANTASKVTYNDDQAGYTIESGDAILLYNPSTKETTTAALTNNDETNMAEATVTLSGNDNDVYYIVLKDANSNTTIDDGKYTLDLSSQDGTRNSAFRLDFIYVKTTLSELTTKCNNGGSYTLARSMAVARPTFKQPTNGSYASTDVKMCSIDPTATDGFGKICTKVTFTLGTDGIEAVKEYGTSITATNQTTSGSASATYISFYPETLNNIYFLTNVVIDKVNFIDVKCVKDESYEYKAAKSYPVTIAPKLTVKDILCDKDWNPTGLVFNAGSVTRNNTTYTHGEAVALTTDGNTYVWSSTYNSSADLSTGIENSSKVQTLMDYKDGLADTKTIETKNGYSATTYPAVYAALNYSAATPEATNSGWYLPACGQWYDIFVNLGGADATPTNYTTDAGCIKWNNNPIDYPTTYLNNMNTLAILATGSAQYSSPQGFHTSTELTKKETQGRFTQSHFFMLQAHITTADIGAGTKQYSSGDNSFSYESKTSDALYVLPVISF